MDHALQIVPIVVAKKPGLFFPEVAEFMRQSGQPLVVHEMEPDTYHPNPGLSRSISIAVNRTEAFRQALARHHDADWFFSLDDDVVPPEGAIETLLSKHESVIGGWYPAKLGGWVGGKWVGHSVFGHFGQPKPGLTLSHLVALGCTLIRRTLLEDHIFDPGIDRTCFNSYGRRSHIGDGLAFSDRCRSLGHELYLDGDVICRHLAAEQTEL